MTTLGDTITMSITFNTTPDKLAELVTKSLRGHLERAIVEQLELQTKDIIPLPWSL